MADISGVTKRDDRQSPLLSDYQGSNSSTKSMSSAARTERESNNSRELSLSVNDSDELLVGNGAIPSDEAQMNMEEKSCALQSPPRQRAQSLYEDEAEDQHREEFLQITKMVGYQFDWWLEIRYWIACLLSSFVIWLMNLWFFEKVVPYRYRRVPLDQATYVLVVGKVHGAELLPVQELGSDIEQDDKVTAGVNTSQTGRMIVFRHMRYIFSPTSNTFILQQSDVINKRVEASGSKQLHQSVAALPSKEVTHRMQTGLTREQWYDNLVLYGVNQLYLQVPSIPTLLYQEVFHPFYVFQMYSVVLWVFEQYYIFAGCIAVIAVVSIVQTLVETRRRMTELSQLARYDCQVEVLRDGEFHTISSTKLVPGDIVQVSTGVLPCDLAVLDGSAIVNESSLTGESVPVTKVAVPFPANRESNTLIPVTADARNTLFSATKVLQLKPAHPNTPVLAMVIRTGFATMKGSLILSILYPKPSEFKFETQSYKFIGALFAISLIGFAISVWQLKEVQDADVQTIIVRGLDLITIVVPPSLPLALTVGVNFALLWLRDEYIFCISPSRISMAGKIRTFCFDKTGTLTAESLEFMGVYPAQLHHAPIDRATFGTFQSPHQQRPQFKLDAPISESQSDDSIDSAVSDEPVARRPHDRVAVDTTHTVPLSPELKVSMACCQSLAVMDGELIGDPLEQQTFTAANAVLQDTGELNGYQQLITILLGPDESVTYGIKEQFEFSSHLQRMSVLCTNLLTNEHWAFVKGSPEKMETLCQPDSVPADFHTILGYFAHQGYRVIAIGRKKMVTIPKLDKAELRDVVERDLTFLGLIVLENKVKPESEPTLQILHQAAIRCVMVTGDHSLTAVTVAKECKLIRPGVRIFQSTLVPDSTAPGGQRIEWIDTDDESLKLDPLTLRLPQSVLNESPNHTLPYELAVTGPVFKLLQESSDSHQPTSYFHRVCLNGQIFARMSPDQKASLVSELQQLGCYTGMCGDGANDCGALKAAHCGVSLSESEASIAAPFTYQRPNISCIPILLSEGRSSLVTSFQLFRYMAMYSMIQFGAVILTYFQGSVLGNWQYLYEDMWLVFPLTILMGSTRANRHLSVKRPSGNLLSVQNLTNLITHILICLTFQIIVYETILNESDFTVLPNPDNTANSYITTAEYYFSNFQYTIIAVFFALGRPWKASLLTNWKFVIWAIISFGASAALLFSPLMQPGFFRTDDIVIPIEWKRMIGLYVLLFLFSVMVWELVLTPLLVRFYKGWLKTGGRLGTVFQRSKLIDGPRSKLYHRLRGEFEASWKANEY